MAVHFGTNFGVTAVGSLLNLDDSATQAVILYPPMPIDIVQFGMVVTEAFVTSVGSFDIRVAYHERAEWDDSSPDSGTDIATLTPALADGAAIGNIIVYTGTKLPFRVDTGRIVTVYNTDGGGTVAGSVRPFLIYRPAGLYAPNPVDTKIFGHTS